MNYPTTEELRAEATKWRIALESLTAQGSEFHNDLDRCVAYVRERYDEGHQAKKDRIRLQRRVAELEAALRHYADKCDNCGHGKTIHYPLNERTEPYCHSYTGFGWDWCKCESFESVASAALKENDDE